MSRGRVILVGAAAMGAYVGKMLDEYEHDSKIILRDLPDLRGLDIPLEGNRKERRSYSSKKLKLKGLRP